MKDFHDFLTTELNAQKIMYDMKMQLGDIYNPDLQLSQQDIALIANVSLNLSIALLRQYHSWLES